METIDTKKQKTFWIVLGLAGVFYFGMYLIFGVGVYNDSDQYIQMHIHREPAYSTFLWILRTLVGDGYLEVAVIIQSLIASFSTAYFVGYMSKTFSLRKGATCMVLLATLAPHIMTPLFSVERVALTSGIMSESLCLPLFLVFVVEMHRALVEGKSHVYTSLGTGLKLSLIRGQMMVTFLVWLVLLLIKSLMEKAWKKMAIIVLCTILAFVARDVTCRTYNWAVQGVFIPNTYGSVNTLANVLYASDREDGEHIEDEELQMLFYEMYDSMEEKQLNYKYATGNVAEKTAYLESVHDEVKFYVVEAIMRQHIWESGEKDYIPQDIIMDEMSGQLMGDLLPSVFGVWATNYILLAINGVIRTIAIVHPLINAYAMIVILCGIGLLVWGFMKKERHSMAWLLAIALLSMAAIGFSTALTIMCLSRYMIYGFSGFYVALYASGLSFLKEKGVMKWVIKN